MQKLSFKFRLMVSALTLILSFIDSFICMNFLGVKLTTSLAGSIINSIIAGIGSFVALRG